MGTFFFSLFVGWLLVEHGKKRHWDEFKMLYMSVFVGLFLGVMLFLFGVI